MNQEPDYSKDSDIDSRIKQVCANAEADFIINQSVTKKPKIPFRQNFESNNEQNYSNYNNNYNSQNNFNQSLQNTNMINTNNMNQMNNNNFNNNNIHYEKEYLKLKKNYDELNEKFLKLENFIKKEVTIKESIKNFSVKHKSHIHPLMKVFTERNGWGCDKCKKVFKKNIASFYCTVCDFDLCSEYINK
jgi:hypothetical protein